MLSDTMRGESLTDADTYAFFIQECVSELEWGFRQYMPDSGNSSYSKPLNASMQTLFDGADAQWLWEFDSIDSLEVTHQIWGYGTDFVYEDSEPTCIKCASETHGIYLRSPEYRDAMSIHIADASDESCGVHCSNCYDTISDHIDTDLQPCQECEDIYADRMRYGGPTFPDTAIGTDPTRIGVPTFTRNVINWHQITDTLSMCLHLDCGHSLTDIDATFALSHHLRAWYNFARHYNGPRYGWAWTRDFYPFTPKMHCQQCFLTLMDTFADDDEAFTCVNCDEPVDWERAYVCREAHVEPRHDTEYKYVPSQGVMDSRNVKVCTNVA
jgi:hypothetical protein